MADGKTRRRRHRLGVAVGVGVSVALHGAVFGAMSFRVADPGSEPASARGEDVEPAFDVAMEIVEIRERIDPEVAVSIQEVESPSPVDAAEPASPSMGAAAAAAPAAAPPSPAELLASLSLTGSSLSMRPRFGSQRAIPGASQQIAALDPHAGHDHGEDEEEGEGFWQKLGSAFGSARVGSGGGKVCKPPVLILKGAAAER